MHAKVGVEFVKNVFLVDCLLLKNIKLKKNNPIDHLLDLLKYKVRTQPLQLNIRELITRVIHQMCAVIPQQYIHTIYQ